jgi:4-hydroxy-tetrahydrodipicolinate reductase
LELVGVYGRRTERAGEDVGELIGLGRSLGVAVGNDLEGVIKAGRPDIAIQATCSRLSDARGEIATLLQHRVSVISIAEEMAWPRATSPEMAAELERLAVANGAALLGTGINPGFVLDLLVITLSGVCQQIESILASRINDLSPYGPSVLQPQGVGLSQEAFYRGIKEGSVVGHYGFTESIGMIAAALGWEIERIEQSREPIIAKVRRQTPFVTVEPGMVAGCHHRAVAYRDGEAVLTLDHPQQVEPQREGIETGDTIEIKGTPHIRLTGSPEIPGGEGTAALAVNMIPRLLNAEPGLYSMAELPVPAALLGDVRSRLGNELSRGILNADNNGLEE